MKLIPLRLVFERKEIGKKGKDRVKRRTETEKKWPTQTQIIVSILFKNVKKIWRKMPEQIEVWFAKLENHLLCIFLSLWDIKFNLPNISKIRTEGKESIARKYWDRETWLRYASTMTSVSFREHWEREGGHAYRESL